MGSFQDLVTRMASLDEIMIEDVDPAELVGDIRGEVDNLKNYLDRLVSFQKFLGSQMAPMRKAKKAAKKRHESLREYIAKTMIDSHFEKLPGDVYRVQLQNNAVDVEYTGEPMSVDFDRFPGLVEAKTHYSWNKEAVKGMLLEGGKLPFAKLTHGRHARFYLNQRKLT